MRQEAKKYMEYIKNTDALKQQALSGLAAQPSLLTADPLTMRIHVEYQISGLSSAQQAAAKTATETVVQIVQKYLKVSISRSVQLMPIHTLSRSISTANVDAQGIMLCNRMSTAAGQVPYSRQTAAGLRLCYSICRRSQLCHTVS